MTGPETVRVQVADLSARIIINQPVIAERVRRYFGSWWRAELEPFAAVSADVHVLTQVHPVRFDRTASTVNAAPHETVSYARTELRVARTGGVVMVYSVDGVAYTWQTGRSGSLAPTQ